MARLYMSAVLCCFWRKSLVAIAIILGAVGLPIEAIGVLFVFDRVLDMARTSVNVFGDSCCAVIIARLEGESLSEDVVSR